MDKTISVYYSPKFEDLILVSAGQNGIVMEAIEDTYKLETSDFPTIVDLNYDLIGYFVDNKE